MHQKKILLGTTLVVLLAAATILYLDSNRSETENPEQSIGFMLTKEHVTMDVQNMQKGDYQISGKHLTVYLGKGSGGNRAEVKQVEQRGGRMFVTVQANFCGKTRDLVPLYASAQLDSEPAAPAEVTIDSEPC